MVQINVLFMVKCKKKLGHIVTFPFKLYYVLFPTLIDLGKVEKPKSKNVSREKVVSVRWL